MLALLFLTAAVPAGAATPVDPDKVVKCRRVEETGKLTGTKRVCKTVAEWRASHRAGEDEARRVTETRGQ